MENSIAILPIIFEEQPLPLVAFFLDAAAKIVSVPDSTFEWFWRFCDPATPRKEERSEVIIAHAEILAARLRAMTGFEREIDCCIRMQYPQAEAAAVRLDWVMSLQMMMQIAQTRPVCHWRSCETTRETKRLDRTPRLGPGCNSNIGGARVGEPDR